MPDSRVSARELAHTGVLVLEFGALRGWLKGFFSPLYWRAMLRVLCEKRVDALGMASGRICSPLNDISRHRLSWETVKSLVVT